MTDPTQAGAAPLRNVTEQEDRALRNAIKRSATLIDSGRLAAAQKPRTIMIANDSARGGEPQRIALTLPTKAGAQKPTDYVLIRLYRPEGYEDVHPDLILQDANINPAFEPEIVDADVLRQAVEALEDLRQWTAAFAAAAGSHAIIMKSPRMAKANAAIASLRSCIGGGG